MSGSPPVTTESETGYNKRIAYPVDGFFSRRGISFGYVVVDLASHFLLQFLVNYAIIFMHFCQYLALFP